MIINRDISIKNALRARKGQDLSLLNPYAFGGGGGGLDPYNAQVALRCHCDGTLGGTSFPDTSLSPKTVTPTSVTTSTAQKLFGTASALFVTGGANVLTVPDNAAFNPAGDFTFEIAVRIPVSTGLVRTLTWKAVATGHTPLGLRIDTDGRVQYFASNTAGSAFWVNAKGTTVLLPSTWYRICVTRVAATYRLFVNGTIEQTTITAGGTGFSNTSPIYFGNVSNLSAGLSSGGDAYLDEIRYTSGVGRYSTNYVVDTAAFPDT